MKNVLFVVDERMMGGVSTLLSDMLNMIDISKLNIDLLVLHNRGDKLENLPSDVNLIFGSPYFEAIDYRFGELLKKKDIKLLIKKAIVVFDMKTGLIKKRIIKERKKILNKHYDFEVAFKDGFTAVFTAYGDSDIKYHWIQYDYGTGNPNEKYCRLFNEILPMFNKIIAVSEGVKRDFNNIYHLEDKTIIINNLVDVDKILKLSKEKRDIEYDKNKINIICVGRLDNVSKGYDRLLNVVNRLNQEKLFDNCILRFFGDGPSKNDLQIQIDEYHLKDKVFLMGRVDNPYKYYKDSDLFVLSSRYEAFGLVLVESMIVGVPVLTTNNSATNKIVSSENGLVVENNEEGLYNGLKKLLTDYELLNKYKTNLKKYKYDNDQILKDIDSLFK